MRFYDRDNEIDMIALNEFTKRGVIAEIKRNERKISMSVLEEKMVHCLWHNLGNIRLNEWDCQ